jgi:homoprotocatechuate degradation regulator HpaR
MVAVSPAVRLRAFSRLLPMALLCSREAVMRHFRPALRAFELTEQQWRVLRALSSIPMSEVTYLARATYLAAPSLSRILRDLEGRGLIERRRSDEDMRFGLVAISGAGLLLIEEVQSITTGIYAEIASRYGSSRVVELMELLAELTAELSEGAPIAVNTAHLKPIMRNAHRRMD